MEKWNILKSHFEADGSLRDIIVLSESVNTWHLFLSALRGTNYPYAFKYGGVCCDMPNDIKVIWKLQDKQPTMLSIQVKGIIINCHFFKSNEIELDIDPKDITTEREFNHLHSFLFWLNKVANSTILLTHENSPDKVIFTVE